MCGYEIGPYLLEVKIQSGPPGAGDGRGVARSSPRIGMRLGPGPFGRERARLAAIIA